MGRLADSIRNAVAAGDYLISQHAIERLSDRRITEWQVASGAHGARLLAERPDDTPNPSIELEQSLPDGTPVKAVWAWLPDSRLARLITVHFYDR